MKRLLYTRLLRSLVVLLGLTLLAFVPSLFLNETHLYRGFETSAAQSGQIRSVDNYKHWRTSKGFNLPVFYFSLDQWSVPDTLKRIADPSLRKITDLLIQEHGNWDEIAPVIRALALIQQECQETKRGGISEILKGNTSKSNVYFNKLVKASDAAAVLEPTVQWAESAPTGSTLQLLLNEVAIGCQQIMTNEQFWLNYIPVVRLHADNQYHRWLFGDGKARKGVIRGDFGVSYRTQQDVVEMLSSKMWWTILITFMSILMAFGIGIPLGVAAAYFKGAKQDRWISTITFGLYAIPFFWMAMLLLWVFSNPGILDILPYGGVAPIGGFPDDMNFFVKGLKTIPYLILPILCFSYSSIAFISRLARSGILEELSNDYVKTARAKGLATKDIFFGHILKNALIPLVTVFTNIFPVAIGGSVILETIFTIPGMGYEVFQAVYAMDIPVLLYVLFLTGLVSMFGFLLNDVLYMYIDPRIKMEGLDDK